MVQSNTVFYTSPTEIIAAYKDLSVDPEIKLHRVMEIGTGGHSIWERYWHSIAMPEHTNIVGKESTDLEHNGLQTLSAFRAMVFAHKVSSQYSGAVQYTMAAYRHSDAGKKNNELFIERFLQILAESRGEDSITDDEEIKQIVHRFENQNSDEDILMSDYIKRHPDDWQTRYDFIERFCKDAFETGKHMTYLGIAFENENIITDGIRIMKHSSDKVEELINDDQQTSELLNKLNGYDQWPCDGVGSEQFSQSRIGYIKEIIDTFSIKTENYNSICIHFLAHTIITHDRLKIANYIAEYLHDLGAKDGGLSTAMRHISDDLFENPDSLIALRAVQALHNNNNDELSVLYDSFGHIQLALIATGYTYHIFDRYRYESDIISDLSLNINSKLDYLRQNINDRIKKQMQTDKIYLHVEAKETSNLIEPGRLERCIERAQSNDRWESFISNNFYFRPYG